MTIKQYKYFYIVAAPQESLNFQGEKINIGITPKLKKRQKIVFGKKKDKMRSQAQSEKHNFN
jgi:hypothetical protein